MSKKPFTLSNEVFKQIRDDIVEGVIQQGQKIVEVNLAKQYNISRGPLREALHQLEYINLVIRITPKFVNFMKCVRQLRVLQLVLLLLI
jgi:DNA-binding GntR family transcriptional regulator